MFRAFVIAKSGLGIYHYPQSGAADSFEDIMHPTLLSAIESYAFEIGKKLRTITFDDHKLYMTKINGEFEELRVVLVDAPETEDHHLAIKAEIVARRYLSLRREFHDIGDIYDKFNNLIEMIFEQNGSKIFLDLSITYDTKDLLRLLDKESHPNEHLEDFVNKLITDIPLKKFPLHPLVIDTHGNRLIIPHNFPISDQIDYMEKIRNTLSPILGEQYIDKVYHEIIETD